MSAKQESPVSFVAGEALVAHRRVKLDSGSGTIVVYAGAGEAAIGITEDAAASGSGVAVRLIKHGGTHKVVCSASVVEGASLYGTASGKVDDAGTGAVIGTALEAGSGDGAVIEAILDQDSAQGLAHIADVAAVTQDALTDNGGGTADGTVASMAAPTTLTDNTGDTATHDDTLADGNTTAALTADNGAGTADGTVEAMADLATGGGNTYSDAAVNAVLAAIRNNFKEVTTKLGTLITDNGVHNQNESDLASKVIEIVTLITTIQNNFKEVTTELGKIKTDNEAQVTKINAILARLEAAGISAAS